MCQLIKSAASSTDDCTTWRLETNWLIFFFFPWKQYQLVNPKWTQAFPALVMVDRCGCQKAHIIFSNDVARLTDSNCIHVLRKDTATGDYNLFLMELFLDFAVNIYIYKFLPFPQMDAVLEDIMSAIVIFYLRIKFYQQCGCKIENKKEKKNL